MSWLLPKPGCATISVTCFRRNQPLTIQSQVRLLPLHLCHTSRVRNLVVKVAGWMFLRRRDIAFVKDLELRLDRFRAGSGLHVLRMLVSAQHGSLDFIFRKGRAEARREVSFDQAKCLPSRNAEIIKLARCAVGCIVARTLHCNQAATIANVPRLQGSPGRQAPGLRALP